ncbi:hypothetical protein KR044_013203, partial [Drosophila immigrans]
TSMSDRNSPVIKVLLLGDMLAGKTSLISQYVNKTYECDNKATVGSVLANKELVLNNSLVTLQIWDTAGQERFHTLGRDFYKKADYCILVFDVTCRKSFENLDPWRNEFFLMAHTENPVQFSIAVIGNKIDLENRQVSKREAEQWCKSLSIPYFECSAKDGSNVQEAFQTLAAKVMDAQLTPVNDITDPFIVLDGPSEDTPPEERQRTCIC